MSTHAQHSSEPFDDTGNCRVLGVGRSTFQFLSANIRLLDLDRELDWPGLSEDTFAIKEDGRTRSKTRYRRAEWLLYKLFAKWDLGITRASLDLFFPPLEPLQSIKLRSTIYSLLDGLKRDGTLPRGCSLRKSMLDDCIGPKFEELLLSFSTVVLQKHLKDSSARLDCALQCATVQELGEGSTFTWDPLAIALQLSLSRRLFHRQTFREHCDDLQSEFGVRDEYFKLLEDCNSTTLSRYSTALNLLNVDRDDLKRRLRNSYNSDRTWLDVAMSGEIYDDRDMLAESDDYEILWARALSGKAQVVDAPNQNSLASCLDHLASVQTQRLQRWRHFQSQVSQRNGELVVTKTPTTSPRKTPRRPTQVGVSKGHHRLLSDTPTIPFTSRPSQRRSLSPQKALRAWATPEIVSHGVRATRAHSHVSGRPSIVDKPTVQNDAASHEYEPLTSTGSASTRHYRGVSAGSSDNDEQAEVLYARRPRSNTETPTLSLAQRTRNSMASTVTRHSRQPGGYLLSADSAEPKENALDEDSDLITQRTSQISLAERARQSMAQIQRSPSMKKPARTTDHRRSKSHQLSRKPAFPVNPFVDSPVSNAPGLDNREHEDLDSIESGGQTNDMQSQSFLGKAGGEDATSIFKPRSKLRTSPPGGSPTNFRAIDDGS